MADEHDPAGELALLRESLTLLAQQRRIAVVALERIQADGEHRTLDPYEVAALALVQIEQAALGCFTEESA